MILCDHNKPFVEIRPLNKPKHPPLELAVAKGEFTVPDDFNAPLVEFERDVYGDDEK